MGVPGDWGFGETAVMARSTTALDMAFCVLRHTSGSMRRGRLKARWEKGKACDVCLWRWAAEFVDNAVGTDAPDAVLAAEHELVHSEQVSGAFYGLR